MRLCKSNAETECLDLHSSTYRESREEVALIRAHVGARLVVITCCDVNIACGQIFQTEDEVTEQIACKLILLHKVARSVVLVGRLVVWQFPLREIIGCHRQTERCRTKSLSETNLDIPGHFVGLIIEFLYLTSQVLCYKR